MLSSANASMNQRKRRITNRFSSLPNMNKDTILNAVSAGMRAMKKEPSAFVFIDEGLDWTWDYELLSGVKVFHAVGLQCSRWGTGVGDCPFVPVGRNDSEITYCDRVTCAEAYDEYILANNQ